MLGVCYALGVVCCCVCDLQQSLLRAQPCVNIKSCTWVVNCDPGWGSKQLMMTPVGGRDRSYRAVSLGDD